MHDQRKWAESGKRRDGGKKERKRGRREWKEGKRESDREREKGWEKEKERKRMNEIEERKDIYIINRINTNNKELNHFNTANTITTTNISKWIDNTKNDCNSDANIIMMIVVVLTSGYSDANRG